MPYTISLFPFKTKIKIYNAEFVSWAKKQKGKKFHAVLCDPPYGLSFMGKDWDDRIAAKEWGEAMLPLLYPGALVFMFGGTRTWHKLATGMEESGFEMTDTLMWLYGTGFPKAQAIDKSIDKQMGSERNTTPIGSDGTHRKPRAMSPGGAPRNSVQTVSTPDSEVSAPWEGWKTAAMKPSWEPILMFRAPRQGRTYAQLAQEFGSGCLNVDGGRIPTHNELGGGAYSQHGNRADLPGSSRSNSAAGMLAPGKTVGEKFKQPTGRYPANLILDEETAPMLDEQSGDRPGSHNQKPTKTDNSWFVKHGLHDGKGKNDTGGASRFFYCAKASRNEREGGLDKFITKSGQSYVTIRKSRATEYPESTPIRNNHPTVKPLSLTSWLATLLLPPDSIKPRRLLVPFSGSGSEIIGAMLAGWDEIVGVENQKDFVKIAKARIEYWKNAAHTINRW